MLFNFELKPVSEIQPFGDPCTGTRSLHWYGLTDGYYWLRVGEQELFRYSDEVLAAWEANDWPAGRVYDDYYLAQLWMDLQERLQDILEPIPEPIPEAVLRVCRPGAQAVHLHAAVDLWLGTNESDDKGDTWDSATHWLSARQLDTGYLQQGPRIWFWRESTDVHISWDNCGRLWNGIPVWAATEGEVTVPLSAFVHEVSSFDRRLMEAMQQRTDAAKTAWPRPDVALDIAALEQEQAERSTCMDHALLTAQSDHVTDWAAVEAAVERVLGRTHL